MRISTTGNNAKNCSDLETIINSKYALLKGSLSGNGSVDNNGDETNTVLIAHNLRYVPMVFGYVKQSDETYWQQLPKNDFGMGTARWVYIKADITNISIIFMQTGESARTFTYQYFIYLDKGKL